MRDMDREGLVVLGVIFHILGLEVLHLVVEDLSIHVTQEEVQVEFHLRAEVETPVGDLLTLKKDEFRFLMLEIDQGQILGVSQIISDNRLKTVDVNVVGDATRVHLCISNRKLVLHWL